MVLLFVRNKEYVLNEKTGKHVHVPEEERQMKDKFNEDSKNRINSIRKSIEREIILVI